jgi:hypothetical protein
MMVTFLGVNALFFHRRYHVMGRVPIVFSLQEQTEGSRGIFPKQFLEELNIQQIRYMMVAVYILSNYNHVTKNSSLKK